MTMQVARAGKGFSFEPRTLTDEPKSFGKSGDTLEVAPGVSEEDPRFRAAQVQHQLSFALQQHLRKEGRSLEWFASAEAGHPGLSVDRVRRMLRGETLMQLADVMLIIGMVPDAMEGFARNVGGSVSDVYERLDHAELLVNRAEVRLQMRDEEIADLRRQLRYVTRKFEGLFHRLGRHIIKSPPE